MRSIAIGLIGLLALAASASAQERQLVTFEVLHAPSLASRDVYLLGDIPELGAGDLTRSVKLVSSDRSTWRVTISLPVNRGYTYRYYDRFRALPADPSNGIPFGDAITGHTDTVAQHPSVKIVYAHSSFDAPVLHWRQDDGSFATLAMRDVGAGRGAGERRWEAGHFGESRRPVEFFLTSAASRLRVSLVGRRFSAGGGRAAWRARPPPARTLPARGRRTADCGSRSPSPRSAC